MAAEEVVIESRPPQTIKTTSCPTCGTVLEYPVPESTNVFKIKCYKCTLEFTPNQENQKTREKKKEKPLLFSKDGKVGSGMYFIYYNQNKF